jgi:hypothetical protein
MLSKTRKAQAEGHDITSRPYLWLPLPGADDHWDEQDVEDYVADAQARRERKRARTRGPAARVIEVDGERRMVLQVEQQITRKQLRDALLLWWVHANGAPREPGQPYPQMPTNRAGLLAAVRYSLKTWGRTAMHEFDPSPEVEAALNILWPEEADHAAS